MTAKLTSRQIETWRLFITAHARLISRFEAEMADQKRIPLHWYDVLIELYEAPERRLRMNELARRVVLSRSGLTRLVDQLEKAGFLTRSPDPADRRGSYAVLADSGIDAMRSAWPIYAGLISRHFSEGLTESEADVLVSVFRRLLDRIGDEEDSPTGQKV